MRSLAVAACLILLCCPASIGRESTSIMSTRAYGMGSCFVTAPEGPEVLFANPAALDRDAGRSAFFSLQVIANTNTYDVAKFAIDHRDDFKNVDDMSEEAQNRFFQQIADEINYKRLNIAMPIIPLAIMYKKLGILGYVVGRTSDVAYTGGSGTPVTDMEAEYEFGGVAGIGAGADSLFSFLPNRVSVGVGFKYAFRRHYDAVETVTALAQEDEYGFLKSTYWGADLGLLYDIRDGLRFGMAVYDIVKSDIRWEGTTSSFSRTRSGDTFEIDPSMRIGVSYYPAIHLPVPESMLAVFEIEELFDGDVEFFRKIHFGVEVSPWSWLALRGGISQGNGSLGAGLGPLSYAYYGVELGRVPGQLTDYRHTLSIGL